MNARERTRSVWDYFLSRKEQFTNDQFVSDVDDKTVGKERMIFPDPTKVCWWPEVFGRTDEEMNGTATAPALSLPREEEPVVTGLESEDIVVGPAANGSAAVNMELNNPFAASAEKLTSSLSSLGFGRASAPPTNRPRTPNSTLMKEVSADEELDSSPVTTRRTELSFQAFARDSAFRDT